MKGRTLLQVIPKLVGGGAERTTLEVADAVVKAGGRSIVVSSGGPMTEGLTAGGSEHVTLPADSKNPWLIAQNARDLRELIEKERVDIIHARSRAPAWSALMAARRTGTPFITTYHGFYKAKRSIKRLYNSVMVRGDVVIANSAFTAHHIAREYKGKPYFDEARVVTIPRGADLSKFGPGAADPAQVEAMTALLGLGLRVVLPGRFTPWKGQRVLVEAAKIVGEKRPDLLVSYAAIGRMDEKPAYVDELRRSIDEAGLTGRFALLPPTDDMAALLLASDIVISASTDPEAFGRVAVEAQASGRPVIASAHGGALETVLDGTTGRLVPPGDAEALARAIIDVNDKGAIGREVMGRSGMEHARTHFTTEAMTSATLKVYLDVLNRQELQGES